MTTLSLAAAGPLVLVGGGVPAPGGGPDERKPMLLQLTDDAAEPVRLTPQSPYGRLAQFEFLGTDGSRIAGVGTATGGAHLNPRWSIWSGTTGGLIEQPQPVEVFGGWNAGSLNAVAFDDSGPLLVGSWTADGGGIGGAMWTQHDSDWRRTASALPLAGTPAGRFLPTGIGAVGNRILVSGFTVTQTESGTGLEPTLWIGDRAGGWQRRALPDGGADGVATGLACAADGCWVVGRIGNRLALWQVDGAPSTAAGSVGTPGNDGDDGESISRVADLPSVPLAPGDDTAVVATDGESLVAAVGSAGRILQRGIGTDWSEVASPAPEVRAVAVSNGQLTAITGTDAGAQVWQSCRPPR